MGISYQVCAKRIPIINFALAYLSFEQSLSGIMAGRYINRYNNIEILFFTKTSINMLTLQLASLIISPGTKLHKYTKLQLKSFQCST
jgi:hypothetical protein